MSDPDAFASAMRIADAFEQANVPYAVGGAIALGIWGVPRGTVDVDVNVFVEGDALDGVIEILRSLGMDLDRDRARREADERGMFVATWAGMRIDVFTPSIEFSHEAFRTRVRRTAANSEAWYLSAEAVSVFKHLRRRHHHRPTRPSASASFERRHEQHPRHGVFREGRAEVRGFTLCSTA